VPDSGYGMTAKGVAHHREQAIAITGGVAAREAHL